MGYRKLVQGFDQFKEDYFKSDKKEEYQKLVEEGQSPDTLVIACSDSRIDPALLTHSKPGEFFAVRNVAALVPPYSNGGTLHGTSSAIEYAVRALNVKHVVVLGHAGCGGINALATGNFQATEHHDFEFLHHWLNIASEAKESIYEKMGNQPEELKIKNLEQASIVVSLKNLVSFPWIKAKYTAGELKIHGWYFDMKNGELLEYNSTQNTFEKISMETKGALQLADTDCLKQFIQKCTCK